MRRSESLSIENIAVSGPLARKNLIDPAEKTVRSFDREKQRLADLVDLDEFREHLKNVRSQIDQVRGRSSPRTPVKNVGAAAAHERFASLLVSPADLRQTVQNNETERVRLVQLSSSLISLRCF